MLQLDNLKASIRTKALPNWVITYAIIAVICLINVYIISASSAETSVQRVQIIYQLSLVVAGAIGLPLAVWRSWTAHRQAITGQKQLEGFQKQLIILEAGAEADRLQKGTELLDSDKMVVRIAGVAILRSIAIQPEHRFKNEAFRVLNAFATDSADQEEEKAKGIKNYTSPADIKEAFDALLDTQQNTAHSISSMKIFGIHLYERNLSANLASLLRFHRCSFHSCTIDVDTFFDFIESRFYDCNISTAEHDFSTYKQCNFVDCKFTGKAGGQFEADNRFFGGDLKSLGMNKPSEPNVYD